MPFQILLSFQLLHKFRAHDEGLNINGDIDNVCDSNEATNNIPGGLLAGVEPPGCFEASFSNSRHVEGPDAGLKSDTLNSPSRRSKENRMELLLG